MSQFKDHFSTDSKSYAAHRPRYPQALVDALASITPSCERAVDCGCGTGQLSVLLASRFHDVVATDASAAQIENAEAHPRVSYRVAGAERSGLPDASVDLVTVAQAAHWFDLAAFYREARRVARPQGVLALVSYGVQHVAGSADSVLQRFYRDVVGSYWPPERKHVESEYRTLPFPFAEIPLPAMQIEVAWTANELVGYVRTWSAVKAAQKALGDEFLTEFEAELRATWPDQERHIVHWPLTVRAGRVE